MTQNDSPKMLFLASTDIAVESSIVENSSYPIANAKNDLQLNNFQNQTAQPNRFRIEEDMFSHAITWLKNEHTTNFN